MSFEEEMQEAVKRKIIDQIKSNDMVKIEYPQRKVIPQEYIEKIWNEVNWEVVLANVTEQLETRICNSIVASMETEIKTDVKSLLSVSGVRDKLRMKVYPELMKVLKGK